MIISSEQLQQQYSSLVDSKGRVCRDVKNGKLFRIVRGLYETNNKVEPLYLAQFIYSPSYISFDTVLYLNNLIPEAIYNTITCATFNKRKTKIYTNMFGVYTYRDVPKQAFSLGVSVFSKDSYSYHIASSEKALCDKLYTLSPVKSIKELKILLFKDLRINKELFVQLNFDDLLKLAPKYHCTNLNLLIRLINKLILSRYKADTTIDKKSINE